MTSADEWLTVESLDLEAQGVAHNAEGKVVFIEGALPGEEVQVAGAPPQEQLGAGHAASSVRRESAQRVVPRCPHFGVCGGCKMQHLDVAAQVAIKQRALEDALWHLGKVTARDACCGRSQGPAWGYRLARAPVGAPRREEGHGAGRLPRAQVELSSPTCDSCDVLPPHVSALLLPLRALIAAMDAARPPAADRARGRRRASPRWCCATSSR